MRTKRKPVVSRRRVIIQRVENQKRAREYCAALLWVKAVIEANERRGLSVGC